MINMKTRTPWAFVIVLAFVVCTSGISQQNDGMDARSGMDGSVVVRPDLLKLFSDCHVDGSIVLFDDVTEQWIISDTLAVHRQALPASTFKILNLLIALETRAIVDEMEVIPWPGTVDTTKYGYRPDIYRDMTVAEAFRESAGWVFIELAARIGRETYADYLRRCHYGNADLSQSDADFWNFGSFGITPVEQVAFVRRLYRGELPFSQRSMEIARRVMLAEQHDGYAIHAKTGWTRDGGINTGWWVGYVEHGKGVCFFAALLLQDRKHNRADFGPCRKHIVNAALRDLKLIPKQ